jgi:hypothetical protein
MNPRSGPVLRKAREAFLIQGVAHLECRVVSVGIGDQPALVTNSGAAQRNRHLPLRSTRTQLS